MANTAGRNRSTMKNSNNNSNHEINGPEHMNLLRVAPPTKTGSTTPNRDLEDVFREMPITEDTACGIWFLQGPNLQRFANKKAYVFLYGVLGCIFSASYAYFNGTITTIEKRFKIPSKTTGKRITDFRRLGYWISSTALDSIYFSFNRTDYRR